MFYFRSRIKQEIHSNIIKQTAFDFNYKTLNWGSPVYHTRNQICALEDDAFFVITKYFKNIYRSKIDLKKSSFFMILCIMLEAVSAKHINRETVTRFLTDITVKAK